MDHAILWAASFTLYKLGTKNLPVATIFLKLVSKRRPEDIFNFKPCIVLNLVYVCQEDHYFHCFHNHSRFTDMSGKSQSLSLMSFRFMRQKD